ncbi:methyltransferase domain-containing protein [Streptomyces sp. DSM 41528]|uniref:Methyltransferase domain-containing protein n=1 Tax=Streptomyces bugieae TaxID=3098223 RepID=A0ABU7NK90_9ACTN|nr:methyltransferase domain-containing protein [Streptomyces sp. DSM 41528]
MNAHYARPAMLALAGDVAGRRILDAGCGSGPLSAALRDRGAVVTGIDSSAGILALARRRRVLRPGGRLIASVDHPFVAYTIDDPRPDYFATTSYTFDWTFNGQSVPMKFWRRPLHAMTDAFTTAGFRLSVISEPQPDPAARELFPDEGIRTVRGPVCPDDPQRSTLLRTDRGVETRATGPVFRRLRAIRQTTGSTR